MEILSLTTSKNIIDTVYGIIISNINNLDREYKLHEDYDSSKYITVKELLSSELLSSELPPKKNKKKKEKKVKKTYPITFSSDVRKFVEHIILQVNKETKLLAKEKGNDMDFITLLTAHRFTNSSNRLSVLCKENNIFKNVKTIQFLYKLSELHLHDNLDDNMMLLYSKLKLNINKYYLENSYNYDISLWVSNLIYRFLLHLAYLSANKFYTENYKNISSKNFYNIMCNLAYLTNSNSDVNVILEESLNYYNEILNQKRQKKKEKSKEEVSEEEESKDEEESDEKEEESDEKEEEVSEDEEELDEESIEYDE